MVIPAYMYTGQLWASISWPQVHVDRRLVQEQYNWDFRGVTMIKMWLPLLRQ